MKKHVAVAAAGPTVLTLMVLSVAGLSMTACTPSVNVNVNLAPIYAKLDVNVKVQLDQDVKALVQQNPNLF